MTGSPRRVRDGTVPSMAVGASTRSSRSLTSVAPATPSRPTRRDLAGVRRVGRARRARRSRARRPHDAAPLPRLPRHRAATPALDRRQGVGAASLLRVARAHGPRSRSTRRPGSQRAEGRRRACPGCSERRAARAARRARLPRSTTTTMRSVCATTPCSSCSTAAGCASAELCGLSPADLDLPTGTVTVWGKGRKQRRVPLSEPAVEAVSRLAPDGRQRLVTDVTPTDALFLNARGAAHAPGRAPHPRPAGRLADPPPRPAAQLRHSPARRWRRPASGAGAARSRRSRDHPALHSREPGAAPRPSTTPPIPEPEDGRMTRRRTNRRSIGSGPSTRQRVSASSATS